MHSIFLGPIVGSLRHSLQERLSRGSSSGKSRADEIYLRLRTSTGSFFPLLVFVQFFFYIKFSTLAFLFLCDDDDILVKFGF